MFALKWLLMAAGIAMFGTAAVLLLMTSIWRCSSRGDGLGSQGGRKAGPNRPIVGRSPQGIQLGLCLLLALSVTMVPGVGGESARFQRATGTLSVCIWSCRSFSA
jgi:hypothetical protein